MRGEGWGDRFVLQAEGLTVSRKAPLVSVQLTINPIKVIFNSRFKRASFDSGFSTIEL